jgi:hypothetical protein
METVLSRLRAAGLTDADVKTIKCISRPNPWNGIHCWSRWFGYNEPSRNIVTLWVNLQPFLHAADPSCRPAAVRAFIEAADVIAYS